MSIKAATGGGMKRRIELVLAVILTSVCTLFGAGSWAANSPAASDALRAALTVQPATSAGQSATQLGDGRWLLLGGIASGQPSNAARVIELKTGQPVALTSRLGKARSGHTATLLPDGTVLILGGTGANGAVVAEAERFNPATQGFEQLGNLGNFARAGHSATVLSDGRLLIIGGADTRGQALSQAELLDPQTMRLQSFDARLDTAQIDHVAALLPNSDVLVWGGVDSAGRAVRGGELFEAARQRFSLVNPQTARQLAEPLVGSTPPALVESLPRADARDVAVDQRLVVRLSKRMDVATLTEQTVTLLGPNGATAVKPVAVEGGLLLFVTPAQQLLPGSRYTLFIQGAADQYGQPLPFTAIGFNTATLGARAASSTTGTAIVTPSLVADAAQAKSAKAAQDAAAKAKAGKGVEDDDDEDWVPNAAHRKGNWRSGRAGAAKQSMPNRASLRRVLHDRPTEPPANYELLRIAIAKRAAEKPEPSLDGSTSLAGQVLRLNGRPLANVRVEMGSVAVKTDAQGEFLLSPVPAGRQLLIVDGESANRPNARYGRFSFLTDVLEGHVNDLRHIVWMPKLDMRNAVDIPSPTTREIVITNPKLPGLELVIPAGTVIRDAHGQIVTQLSITPIPIDQMPFPMPYPDVPIYFTVQPGGALIQGVDGKPRAATLRYPNYTRFGPGHRVELFDYDPKGRGWYIYGEARVSSNGERLVSDRDFNVYQFTATSANPGPKSGALVSDWPTPPECPVARGQMPGNPGGSGCGGGGSAGAAGSSSAGDPVNLAVGHFENTETDLVVPDVVPLALTRTYRTLDKKGTYNIIRPFGFGSTHPYEIFIEVPGPTYSELNVVLPNSTRISFIGGSDFDSNQWVQNSTSGEFHQAIIYYHLDPVVGGTWILYFRDGRRWSFPVVMPRLRWTEDRNGNRVTLNRPGGTGHISQILGPTGRYINLTYANGNISQATDHTGRTVKYGYDASMQRLISVTNPDNKIRTYTWDTVENRITSIKDERNNIILTNDFQGDGRVSKQTLNDGKTFTYAYTVVSGAVTKTDVTDRRGSIRRTEFNARGNVVKDTFPVGTPIEQVATYDIDTVNGRRRSMTDPLGRRTEFQYDSLGNVTQVKRLANTTAPVTENMTYSTIHSGMLQRTDANGKLTTLTYDEKGNLTQVKNALNNTTQVTYDQQGRVTSVKNGLNVTTATMGYTGADLTSVTDALSRTTTISYDAVGRLSGVRDPLGRVTTPNYDVLNRVTKIADPIGATVQLTYDENGNVATYADPRGGTTNYTYDSMDRRATRKDALTRTETYAYENGGEVSRITDRKSQVSGFAYDALGRVAQRGFGATTVVSPVYTSRIDYTWDKGNRLRAIVDSVGGTITRTYNDLDQVLTEVTTQGTVTYTYDLGGRRKTMQVSGQPLVSYTWDDANRLTQIQQAAGASNNSIVQTVAFTYDNAGQRKTTTYSNGATIYGATMTYVYDNAGQISSITYKKLDGSLLGDITYTYDGAGQRLKPGGSFSVVRFPPAVASAIYNANNQLTNWGGTTLTYDNNGNLTNDGSLTYTWDARNQLVALGGAVTATFSYDGLGRRIGKTVGAVSTGYVYDGLDFIQEKNGTGATATPTANLVTGLGIDETFLRMTGSGISARVSGFLPDGNNNTLQLVNNWGSITDTYSYQAYGTTTRYGDNTNTQQYTGRENDGTGLYFYRARYYHPAIGRFVSEDPIGFAAGPNLYAYVDGNPISFTDPDGLLPILPVLYWAGVSALGAWNAYQGYQSTMEFRTLQCKTPPYAPNATADAPTPGQVGWGSNPTFANAMQSYTGDAIGLIGSGAFATFAAKNGKAGLGGVAVSIGGYAAGAYYATTQPCPCQ